MLLRKLPVPMAKQLSDLFLAQANAHNMQFTHSERGHRRAFPQKNTRTARILNLQQTLYRQGKRMRKALKDFNDLAEAICAQLMSMDPQLSAEAAMALVEPTIEGMFQSMLESERELSDSCSFEAILIIAELIALGTKK